MAPKKIHFTFHNEDLNQNTWNNETALQPVLATHNEQAREKITTIPAG